MRTADLVLVNADVVTLADGPAVSAVAMADGRVIAVGDDVRPVCDSHTEVVDLRGACVLPGFTDGHTHPVFGLELTAGVDLSGCTTLESLRAALASAAPVRGWILGHSLNPNVFEHGRPRSDLLVDVLGDRPMLLRLFDGHAALASPAALRAAGIDGPREFIQRAQIVCDEDGRPTGHLLEFAAIGLVEAVLPAEPERERAARLRDLLARMAATGLTGGHVMDGEPDTLALMDAVEQAGDLPLRLRLAPWCQPETDPDGLRDILDRQARHGRRWSMGGVKFFLDGTIDGGTAWLDSPDCYGESTGPFWPDPGAYSEAIRFFADNGVTTATHAIGDAAVRHVLDTMQGLTSGVRHRVEHIETLPAREIPRFARLGVIASMQPTHCTDFTRADHTDNWSVRLSDERASRGWPCADLRATGATLVLGSDWPIAPFDPREVLTAAQLRRPARDGSVPPHHPEQALTALQAIEGYTTHAAIAAGEQGGITVGGRADLTVLAANPLRIAAVELPDVPVRMTIVDGRVVHSAE
ncbi:amidohydrolase [Actinocrispum wychmicini]|uniref:Amidohydrolase 3 domain-containing protein n=1 Tax=Actinocrispum wychmicini TaxID=1213861 RepID=A0A4R2J084_9PSEU|nr:amidohydrolase [Actinocrispum wychmicini]TCO50682.1 hypothetical protein EV192_11359 [Actinocrispum wychmicini]